MMQGAGGPARTTTENTSGSYTSFHDIQVADDEQLRKIEQLVVSKVPQEMITDEICCKLGQQTVYDLLRKYEKSFENYESLLVRDKQLTFESLDFGCLKYLGQTR